MTSNFVTGLFMAELLLLLGLLCIWILNKLIVDLVYQRNAQRLADMIQEQSISAKCTATCRHDTGAEQWQEKMKVGR
jgi:hypothetical protein